MYHFLAASADATVYQAAPGLNTGADEIIELGSSPGNLSRALIRFDASPLHGFVSASEMDGRAVVTLFVTEAGGEAGGDLAAYPVTTPWTEGSGRRFAPVTPSGATWERATSWSEWREAGGDIDTSRRASAPLDLADGAVRLDVSGVLPQAVGEGLLLAREGEPSSEVLKLFSRHTHTVFQPLLAVRYDDSLYAPTGFQRMREPLRPEEAPVVGSIGPIAPAYAPVGLHRFRLRVRPAGRRPVFIERDPGEGPTGPWRLPEGLATYSLVDRLSGVTLIPHSDESRVSFGRDGHFFDVDLRNVQPERDYDLSVRYTSLESTTHALASARIRVSNR